MFKEVKQKIEIWIMCIKMSFKSQLQYQASFILKNFVMFLSYLCEFVATYFLINKVSQINDWTKYEVMLIYGIATVAYAISRLLFCGINNIANQLKNGSFLIKLVRPKSDLFCMMIEEIPIDRIGQVILGGAIVLFACIKLHGAVILPWLLICLITGTIIYSSLFVITASVSFWIINSRELMGVLTHGTLRAIVYPISIYNKVIREIFTYLIPVSFISYYPAIIILDKKESTIMMKGITVLVSVIMWIISKLVWRIGIEKYEGVGG